MAPPRKPPLTLVKLERRPITERGRGRPRKLEQPPMPQEVLDGFSELELEHYHYFKAAFETDYPNLTMSDRICLEMAALAYVSHLRAQAVQLVTGELLSQSRQNPGAEMRQWLDSMATTRKQRKTDPAGDEKRDWLAGLAKLSS